MKKSFLFIFMLMVLACSARKEKPELMSEESMAKFLIELHMAEAGVQDLRLTKDSASVVFRAEEKLLFKKFNITDSIFYASYNYYLNNPDKLEVIYSAIIDSLSLEQVLLRESTE